MDSFDSSTDIVPLRPKVKLYKRRWFMLFLFSMCSLENGCIYSSLASINKTVTKYYDVKPEIVDWLANCFLLLAVFIAIPSSYFIEQFGVRMSVILTISFNSISACLHLAGVNRNGFIFVVIGQVIAAFAICFVLQIPAKFSGLWFGNEERNKATSIGILANVFGVGLGFIQPTSMVEDSDDMKVVCNGLYQLYISQLITVLITLLSVYVFFEEKPPLPPNFASIMKKKLEIVDEEDEFWSSLKILASDLNFNLLMHGVGIYYGMAMFILVTLDQFLGVSMSQKHIGWIGFIFTCSGILGIVICATIVDKYKCYRLISILLLLGSITLWTLFTLFKHHIDGSFLLLMIFFSIFGLFANPLIAHGVEQGVEMTYPVAEGTTSGFLFIACNLYAFLFIVFLGKVVDQGRILLSCYISIGIYGVSFVFILLAKTRLKRQESEEKQKNKICGIGDSCSNVSSEVH